MIDPTHLDIHRSYVVGGVSNEARRINGFFEKLIFIGDQLLCNAVLVSIVVK